MKRCPECRRDYYDDSLAYCLDDGSVLVDGPAQDPQGEEPTARFSPASTVGSVHKRNLAWRSSLLIVIGSVLVLFLFVTGYFLLYKRSDDSIDSIAILPISNDSGDSEFDYLSDGVTESLINNFAGLTGLKVIPRSTAFHFKGQTTEPQAIGKQLGVRAVVTGRIVRHGDMLKAQIELTDVDRNSQLWGNQFDMRLADVLTVQKQISAEVFEALRLKLSNEQQKHIDTVQPDNSEAYLLYLKGIHQTALYTKEGLSKGLDYFNDAVKSDPEYARAYSGIAYNYVAATDWFVPAAVSIPKAEEAAKKALKLDDRLSEAHTSLATCFWWYERKYDLAEAEYKRAIELNPNEPRARAFYGWFLIAIGRTEEGIAQSQLATKLDPLSAEMAGIVGSNYYFARRYDLAISQLKAAYELDANLWLTHSFLGRSYLFQGQNQLAVEELQKAVVLEPLVAESKAVLAFALAKIGRREEAKRVFDSLNKERDSIIIPKYNEAKYYVGNDDKETAFRLLDEAINENSFYATWIKVDPELDPLRNDPRFADLLRKAGLGN